jgi:nucleotide-binding universal stress UspA family protein
MLPRRKGESAMNYSEIVPTQYRVIAASDFSPLGDRAVVEALQVCAGRPHSALHVITVAAESAFGVVLPGPGYSVMAQEDAQERARNHLATIIDEHLLQGHALSLDKVACYVSTGAPASAILGLAEEIDADLIVLGTHGRGALAHMILGSVTGEVMRRATCGVFVIRPRDFLRGEKLPEIEPPLSDGQHSLLPVRSAPTYHYVHRNCRASDRVMPGL